MAVPFWLKAAMVTVFGVAMFFVANFLRWSAGDIGVWFPWAFAFACVALAWFIERWRAKRGLPPL